jgi:hypothetical protein
MGHEQLTAAILKLSVSTHWDPARLEWKLKEVYFANEAEECLCGHYPIIELCVLRNLKNHKTAVVGNHCVKKFMGLQSDKLFVGIKRIRRDIKKAMNAETVEFASQQGWLTDWDRTFYFDTWRKRVLSDKQLSHRVRINRKVLARVDAARSRAQT